ncbi:MAG TPA: hypothetical protein VM427_04360, partial [Patescibacteria group bacterium]|nr:hypothetical protein [Patescibacteria group bacterium]
IIPWNDDASVFVANALSPAQVISVDIDEEKRIANVTVPERMLSLAIGREGQNARLAARLTGWRIDIRSDVSVAAKAAEDEATASGVEAVEPEAGAAEGSVSAVAPDEAVAAEAPVKNTRTKKAAVADDPEPDPIAAAETTETVEAPPKKPRAKKAAVIVDEPAADSVPEADAAAPAPAKKPRAKKPTVTEEVAS